MVRRPIGFCLDYSCYDSKQEVGTRKIHDSFGWPFESVESGGVRSGVCREPLSLFESFGSGSDQFYLQQMWYSQPARAVSRPRMAAACCLVKSYARCCHLCLQGQRPLKATQRTMLKSRPL